MSEASKTSDNENLISLLMSGGYLHVKAGKEIERLTAELAAARKALEEAGGLIEEIATSGTHTRWKRTANAIAELNEAFLQGQPK